VRAQSWRAHHYAGLQLVKEHVRRIVLLCPGGVNKNKIFKSIHIWHADPDWLAPRMFPQFPGAIARIALDYASGAFKSPNMCNLLLTINFSEYMVQPTVECPVLLLWGDEDTILCPRDEDLMLEGLPQGEGYWVEGGSHMLIADSVLTIAEAMEGFLEDGQCKADSRALPWLDRFLRARLLAGTKKTLRPMALPAPDHSAPEIEPMPYSKM